MEDWESLFLIGGSLFAGTVVPGQSFVVVTQIALSDRWAGVVAALGVAITSVVFAISAPVGLVTILQQVPAEHLSLKVAGGLYLIYLGWRMWNAPNPSKDGLSKGHKLSASRALWLGTHTQASNPKAALVYTSTFAAFLPENPGSALPVLTVAVVLMLSAGWYGAVALAASLPNVSAQYRASKRIVDRISAAIISGLGLGIIAQTAFGATRTSEIP